MNGVQSGSSVSTDLVRSSVYGNTEGSKFETYNFTRTAKTGILEFRFVGGAAVFTDPVRLSVLKLKHRVG